MKHINQNNNELSLFKNTNAVFYVETAYQPELNNLIQANYSELVELFAAKSLDFHYLPFMLEDERFWEILNYNRPYVQQSEIGLDLQALYAHLISKLKNEVTGSVLLLSYELNSRNVLIAFPINESFNSVDTLKDKLNQIDNECHKLEKNRVYFHIGYLEEEQIYESSDIYHQIVVKDADTNFDKEAFQLVEEILERIERLREFGSLSLIGNLIEEIQGVSNKLSSLFITNDYRIFLKDYGMKEVVMPPLAKSLYILFLRHPEGIFFKQLFNYHDELLSIYRNIFVHENIDRAKKSIRAMTDPMDNSINKKCSHIRAAFLEVIGENLAQNYYVTGKRGEAKKITLDRSMVEFQ